MSHKLAADRLTLREAAAAAGKHRVTIWRWISVVPELARIEKDGSLSVDQAVLLGIAGGQISLAMCQRSKLGVAA